MPDLRLMPPTPVNQVMSAPDPHLAFIWQRAGWPAMVYDGRAVSAAVAKARRTQGTLEGRLAGLGTDEQLQLTADSWTDEALSTAAIEGETLDMVAVRSSVARRLGISPPIHARSAPRDVEGLLDIMGDATGQAAAPLDDRRLQRWQAALFPTGYSGMREVLVGQYRTHAEPMQIISGHHGRKKVHYEAPPSSEVRAAMKALLAWVNEESEPDSLVRAAVAHLWFETIHPFEDGNGRVGRALVDLILAREAGPASRMVRISQQLAARRDTYYAQLERSQRGGLDITEWTVWFVQQIREACLRACLVVDRSLAKARFWLAHRQTVLNARQRKAVNLLLDAGPGGFVGGMSASKYASVGSTSRATATRELADLVALGVFRVEGVGRGTRYQVDVPGWDESVPT